MGRSIFNISLLEYNSRQFAFFVARFNSRILGVGFMPKLNISNRRLQRDIVVIIVFKLIILVLIWQFFFSANRVDADSQAVGQHMFQAASAPATMEKASD